MTSSTVTPKRGRGRPVPSPMPILDRESLLQALDARDIVVTKTQIDGFYQALHRSHYPPLDEFVRQYYQNENEALAKNSKSNSEGGGGSLDQNTNNNNNTTRNMPLKNSVTNKKNRNKVALTKTFLQFLADPNNGFVTVTSKVAKVMTSGDGSTTKLAVQLHDGQLVESVLMRYGPKVDKGYQEKCGRASLCVSSQVGCAMGCNFCATGMMGLTGDLNYAEILEQVIHANRILGYEALERRVLQEQQQAGNENDNQKHEKPSTDLDVVRNIVFMGMGEPLDNYTNVVAACRALIDRKRWNLAHGRVTVSTVGIASKIRKLTQELPEVSLAMSLHAPNQRLRSQIVPTAKHYPIEDMIDALDGHMVAALKPRKNDANTHHRKINGKNGSPSVGSRRRAMIEYVMLEGETSTLESAHELGKLCEGKSLVVNLIPYNQTDVKDKLRCPSQEHIKEFQRIVASYGTFCTVRRTMGADIDSACGQLVVLDKKKEQNEDAHEKGALVMDIEDGIPSGKTITDRAPAVKKPQQQSASSVQGEERKEPDGDHPPNNGLGADLEKLILPLQVATALSASCFLLSTVLYMKQRRR